MRKIVIFTVIALIAGCGNVSAQREAEIKFDTLIHDFGTFSEKEPVVSYEFKFTNVGNMPLVIHQAIASCGCTVPEYTKEPVLPGKTGTVQITYNGTGKVLGHFKKSITLRTNGKTEMLRLYIEGDMTE
ncbi:hypothetical protein EZS27_039736 [termite gut metagenome]|uniref:DUF1573 domain-containing protein n=1 Tax=termite gut metagenome TaxID=433724 RepID=A0A5J4PJM2_9ZZZZ